MGRSLGRSLHGAVMLSGLGISLSIILLLLWSQASFGGFAAPLQSLKQPDIRDAIWLSVRCALLASLLGLLFAIPSAYILARHRFPGRAILDALLDIPLVMSPIAIGITLLIFFRSAPGGWIEAHLLRFVFETPGIVLAQFIVVSALQIRILKATFEDMNPRMELVARYLGCGPWTTMARVTLPLARTGLLAAFVLGFGRAIGEYGATVTIAGSVRGKTETMPVAVVARWSSVRIEEAIGLVLLLIGIAIVALLAVRLLGRART